MTEAAAEQNVTEGAVCGGNGARGGWSCALAGVVASGSDRSTGADARNEPGSGAEGAVGWRGSVRSGDGV